MRIAGIVALLAGLALSGPALADGAGGCFGSTHQSVSTENGTLTVTATKPAEETVAESEKKVTVKKDTNG
ncbi:MAG: hypothetical protein QF797_14155 [Alphaproteobacteria bacterium]|jgi:hypothetical protein|nr:hypothetical protein [Alphaproteobacteria bacterium]HJP21691.1 hypothetical protein [Alphaproteobacteria bacterium]|tara:strand:- start:785 stop:994 length:210 start_codon:yes stop_codon:yes gene_type:complete